MSISIHAAREGGDDDCTANGACFTISIHAAREGGDPATATTATTGSISIHAAREGGDPFRRDAGKIFFDFNPRRP